MKVASPVLFPLVLIRSGRTANDSQMSRVTSRSNSSNPKFSCGVSSSLTLTGCELLLLCRSIDPVLDHELASYR
eukprot:1803982-Rhodomonas_salina.1